MPLRSQAVALAARPLRRSQALSATRTAPGPAREAASEAAPRPTSTQAPAAPRGPAPERYVNAYVALDGRLRLVQRDAAGRRVVKSAPAEWVSYCATRDLDAEVTRYLRTAPQVAGLREEGPWTRIAWADPRSRKRCCGTEAEGGWFAARGIATYEADLDPARRYFLDHGVGVARPRTGYLDLEADSRLVRTAKERARMLAWALCDSAGRRVASAALAEDSDRAERALVEALWAALAGFDQVVAWAGEFFDFPYLEARTLRRGLRPERQDWLWLDHLNLFRRYNVSASDSGDEKQSLALDAVARSLGLGGKLEGVDRAQSYEEWREDPERLLRYCERDAELMALIEERTGYVGMLADICEVMGVFPDTDGISPSRQCESYMMRLGRVRGMRFPTHHWTDARERAGEKFKGAYVMEPRAGVLRHVHVFDFSRMYPGNILTWNMSPETIAGSGSGGADTGVRTCTAPLTEVAFLVEPVGLLPQAVAEMLRLRKVWDDEKKRHAPGTPEWKEADRRSTAYKNAGNAFFGVMGLVYSRFYVRALAESIAQAGVWLVQETLAYAAECGLDSVYSDTDSGFALVDGDDAPAEAVARWEALLRPGGAQAVAQAAQCAAFEAFVAECNARLYPRLLSGRGCTRNHVRLEYEKAFAVVVFLSKKRYAGRYLHFKGAAATAASKPEIKGLAYKRGDTAKLARELQQEAIHMLLGYRREEVRDPNAYALLVVTYKQRVLSGKLAREDVALSKKLTKEVRKYKRREKKGGGFAAQPAHVEVARMLEERGEEVGAGRRVEYVVIDGEAKPARYVPAEDYDGSYDAHYLWEHLVFPPTLELLEAAFPEESARWLAHASTRPPKPRARAAKPRKPSASERTLSLLPEDEE